jgi:hypothetical protein
VRGGQITDLLRRGLRPSLADLLLASLVGWLFVANQGWSALLADGDTGWHIRTGEWILENRSVPVTDLFSFSLSGAPWFAWEWLADLLMALAHRAWGLAGVAALAGCLIALAAMVLFRSMLWRGAQTLVALAVVLLATGASSIHYLARPHIFSLLLLAVSLWLVERDRRAASPAVWLLVPLSAVWINLHGGFFALPATLAVLAAGTCVEAGLDRQQRSMKWAAARRLAALTAATLGASLFNPYGIGLHRHVASYLTSDWIRGAVDEFQSPRFRSENLLHFELLLVAALLVAGTLLARRRVADALLVVFWADLALASVRHVPLFVVVNAPLVAVAISRLWERSVGRSSARSVGRILWTLGVDLGAGFGRFSFWGPVLVAGVMLLTPADRWPSDFPASSFPVRLTRYESSRLTAARVFTSDQWGDYLIYHGWPQQKVFIDGRSDFYGPGIGNDYVRLMEARPGWANLFRKYEFGVALLPRDWPLAGLLGKDPAWRLIREDGLGVLYERRGGNSGGATPTAQLRRYKEGQAE